MNTLEQKSILLVDDDKDLLESTEFLLKSKAYDTYIANDGLEAIDIYKSVNPCLVFMDVKMPNIDGIEVFYKIRDIDAAAKVILVSAYVSDDQEIENAKNNGLLLLENKQLALKN